eukprot:TRINITY_DN1080_c1_g1_i1.p1 TRINITY_DN1080_c1_g1~~TRINITY_DN1080_c1_g1_i1.p1  ORF type:complete len:160 (-),score=23.26 TRINITY_DN1080_c1_g1_i1:690-1169(-)
MDGDDLQSLKDVFRRHKERTGKSGFDASDYFNVYQKYNAKHTRKVVEEIIWEGDHNADRVISLQDAISSLVKARQQPYTCEAFRLANIIEFMMHDIELTGSINMEQCIIIMSKRFGLRGGDAQPKMRRFIMESSHSLNRRISFNDFEQQMTYRRILHGS